MTMEKLFSHYDTLISVIYGALLMDVMSLHYDRYYMTTT
jgi:hypothetical protein